jgi:D-mannonate dehydratase
MTSMDWQLVCTVQFTSLFQTFLNAYPKAKLKTVVINFRPVSNWHQTDVSLCVLITAASFSESSVTGGCLYPD